MKKILPILFCLSLSLYAQVPTDQDLCHWVDAGPDQSTCGGLPVTLTAHYADMKATTSYAVGSVPYAPFSFTTGTNILIDIDDIWGSIINMGFNFCYYGNNYNQLVVGSNGVASFNTAYANGYCQWPINAAWPDAVAAMRNTIGCPWHDIDPSVGYNPNRIKIHVDGVAPCRKFIVTFNQIPMFSGACNSQLATHQMIMYESSNVIDMYIANKPLCATWNGGKAIQGIQNAAGNQATVVPGRNSPTQWNAANDGKRFYPTGAPTYVVTWLQGATVVGTGASITVNPSVTTTYTVRVNYTNCNGTQTTVTDNVTVNVNPITPPFIPPVDICGGAAASLNAGPGFSTYQWSNGGSGQTISVNPAATTTYSVTLTNAAGCTTSASTTVTVGNNIVAPTIPPAQLCEGTGTVPLNAGAGFATYNWSNGQSGQTITVGPLNTTTTYTVSVTNAAGCTAVSSVTVTVNPITPPVFPPTQVCAGAPATLNAGAGYSSYAWSNGASGQTITVNPATPTTYNVTVTNAAGCTTSSSVLVSIATITPPVIVPPPICSGSPISINAGPGFTNYVWSTGATGQTISVSPTTGTSYTVTVTDANGCTAVGSAAVTVNPVPVPSISGSTTFCAGGNTSLTAPAGFSSYQWSGGLGTGQSINVTTAGTYSVTVTNANGCSGSASTTVTVSSSLNPVIVGNVPLCTGQTTTLDAGAGFSTYLWAPGGATAQTLINVAAGTYTVTVTAANGCSGTASTTVVNSPDPSVAINGNTVICNGVSNTLTATPAGFAQYVWSTGAFGQTLNVTSAGTYNVTITNASGCTASNTFAITPTVITLPPISANSPCSGGPVSLSAPAGYSTYTWSNGASGQNITVNPLANTTYTLTITDANGCTASTDAAVTVAPPLVVTTDGNQNACFGAQVFLGVNNPIGADSYQWSNGDSGFVIAVTPATTTTYVVTVSVSGCTATASQTVFVSPLPPANAGPDVAICNGGSIPLTATGGVQYAWNNGGGSGSAISVTPTTTTTYTVTVTDSNNCSATDAVTVTVNTLPTVTISSPPAICAGETATLTASGGTNYLWSDGSTGSTVTVSPAATTIYTVTATDANGCTGVQSVNLTVNAIPQALASNNGPVCTSQVAQLIGDVDIAGGISPGSTVAYSWTGPAGFTSSSQTIIIDGDEVVSGTYNLVVTINGCPSQPASTDLQTLPSPLATASNDGPACGDDIQLTGNSTVPGSTYSWTGPNGYTSTDQNPVLPGATAEAGSYILIVTGDGCPSDPVITNVDINPIPDVNINGDVTICPSESTTLTAVAVAPAVFTQYAWSNGGTAASTTVSTPGTYTVTATTNQGCVAVQDIVVTQNPTPSPAIGGNLTVCPGASTTLSVAPAFSNYLWSSGGVSQSVTVTPATTTAYAVTVTDANGCTAIATANVVVNPAPTVTIAGATAICTGNSTVLSATGGFTTYAWSNGAGSAQTATVTPATTTTYVVTVTDANGCSGTDNHVVTVAATLNPGISGNLNICNGAATTLNVTGAGFSTYTWSNGDSGPSTTVSNAGTYTVTVADAIGCTGTVSATVVVNALPTVSVTGTPACGGIATVDATPGFASYLWNNGATTASINPTIAGNYVVTVTDANGCTASGAYNLVLLSNPVLTVLSVTDATCGNSDGSVSLSATGGTAPLTYTWSQNAGLNNPTATGLPGGTYTVTVTGVNGCSATQTVTVNNIAGPTISAMTPANATCTLPNGSINVTAAGGTAPLVYAWSQNALLNSPSATGLGAGTYTVTITDDNGCTATQSATITNLSGPTLAIGVIDNAACGVANGTASVVVAGGTAPITYTWSQNAGLNSPNAINLAAGSYTVTATDANGCQAVQPLAVANEGAPTLTVLNTGNTTCGDANGSITVSASGGTGALVYTWSHDPALLTGSATNLPAGNYFVTVTDANGCNAVQSVTLVNAAGPTLQITGITPDFCTNSNGSISVTASGGTGLLTYSWSQNPALNSPNAVGLPAGPYTISVTDVNGCLATINATVNPTSNPTLTVTAENPASCGQANGSGTVAVAGGTPPYTYSWSQDPGLNANAASDLAAGSYTVTVTGSSGCSATTTVNIPTLNAATLTLVSTTNATCGGSNGSITISATGGNGALTYSWSQAPALDNTTATGLAAGTYTVSATDATGCVSILDITISNDPGPAVSVIGVTPTSCGNTNGSILVSASGGTGAITYSWSHNPALNDPNPTGLGNGTYTVTVTDANGCSSTQTATVSSSNAPTLSISNTTAATCGLDNGSITFAVTGGSPGFNYEWSHDATLNNPTATGLAGGTYTITVTDSGGCTATETASISSSNAPVLSVTNIIDATCGLNNGSVTVSATGGTGAISYSWSQAAGLNNPTANNLAGGTYTVTITDANGCTDTDSATVLSSNAPTVSVVSTTNAACGVNNGSITFTAVGGTGAITYTWSQAAGLNNPTATGLAAGTYTVTVTDAIGCTDTDSATITNSNPPSVTENTNTPASCGQADGAASVTVTGGTGLMVYSWSQNLTLDSPNATDLAVGSYTVTVTDENGCTDSVTIDIGTLNGPQLSLVSITDATCTDGNGSIVVSNTGGTGGTTFAWSQDASLNNTTASGLASGTYSVTVTDDNGCQDVLSGTVDFFGPPTATLNATGSDCGLTDGSASATIAGGTAPFDYVWQHDATLNAPDAAALAPGDYAVTVTDANGCTATADVVVPGNMPPPAPVCGIATNSSVQFVWTAIPGATGYEITVGGVTQTLPAGTLDFTVSGLAQDTQVSFTISALGPVECGNSITVTQDCISLNTVCPPLTPVIGGLAADYCVDEAAVTLSGTPAGGVFSGNGISGSTFDPAAAGIGSHIITYDFTDPDGCFYTTTLPVTVVDVPVALFTAPAVICLGDAATFNFTGTASATSTYSWNFGNAGTQAGVGPHSITWNSPGTYTATLSVSTPEGCTDIVSQDIGVSNVNVTATTAQGFINSGASAQLNASASSALSGALTYLWTTTGGGISCIDCANPIANPVDDLTTYTITVNDEYGCEAIASLQIGLIYQKLVTIPNAFSPNGDGENDVFRLSGVNVQSLNLYVFDRWGGQKFEAQGITIEQGWDGTYKGKNAELGVYVYYAEVTFTDGTEDFFKGNVTLIR